MTKVVCIYHFRRERAAWKGVSFPKFGEVYTVIARRGGGGAWLLLAEIENPVCWHGGWAKIRFRPIVEEAVAAELQSVA